MYKKHFKDDLIILKKFPINENDLLINAYGRFNGKIQLKAKGAKNIRSKFTGRLEPFQLIEAEIYNSGKSLTLTQATLKNGKESFPFNLNNFNLSQKICLLINKTVQFNEQNQQLFQILENIANGLQNNQSPHLLENFFLAKLLDLTGVLPAFTHCNNCSEKLNSNSYFNQTQILCQNCHQETTENKEILSLNTLKLINYIKNSNHPAQIQKIKIPSHNNQEANKILDKLLINLLHA